MHTSYKCYHPYISPFDPCKPIQTKCYSTPPNLYMTFQPTNLRQYDTPYQALCHGTLWPDLFDPYPNVRKEGTS
ncbi:CotJA protein [Gracilibacillus halophilus YIM-C55.5]|uniref:CotJA protein n=1 Tax=Gracilibacillus halophilus YIM-C55.5 TaxID=1308866 RepID=N4WWA0_9BACI|nr:spore coat associated protein CotJA [Gracilibacillus halophilus]ENH97361.1 CotJA protein [Gracilibacillus halophilus YIM-C55.5]